MDGKKTLREGDVVGKIDPALYWQWRTSLSEYQKAELETKLKQLHHGTLLKDQEIQRLKSSLFVTQIQSAKEKELLLKKEYEKDVSKIEELLGCQLRDCLIDDFSFEVKYFGKGEAAAEKPVESSTEQQQQI